MTRHMDGLTIPRATIGKTVHGRNMSGTGGRGVGRMRNSSGAPKIAVSRMTLNSWTQNWRNKALQDEDKPSCQEGGWNWRGLEGSQIRQRGRSPQLV